MSVNPQPRQPSGAPSGGQFSATENLESDGDLLTIPGVPDFVDAEAFMENVERAVRIAYFDRLKRAPSLDELEDTSSQVTVEIMGRPPTKINVALGGYITGMARNVVTNQGRRGHRRSDIAARAALAAWREQFRAGHHREPTRKELDAAAAHIRDGWDVSSKHGRPSRNFQADRMFLDEAHLDAPSHPLSDVSLGASLAASDGGYVNDAAEALTEKINRVRTTEGAGATKSVIASATSELWDTLAASDNAPPGTPPVARAHVGAGRVAKYRSTVLSYPGGVLAVAGAWESGADDTATDALFAPYEPAGERLPEEGRQAVVNLLYQYRQSATSIWGSAMGAASRRKSRAVGGAS